MSFAYPVWMVVLACLLGAAYAAALYVRDNGSSDLVWRRWRPMMAVLRFLAASALLVLLLDPLLRERKTETEAPLVLVALDESASIVAGGDSSQYQQAIAALDGLQSALGKDYDVRSFAFGEALRERLPGEKLTGDAPATDMAAALAELDDRFAGRNVGAVILASDGLVNRGSNPAYATRRLDAPILSVGLGDTTSRRDLRLERSYLNRIVYLDDRYALELDLSAHGARGESSRVTVDIVQADGSTRRLGSQNVAIDSKRWSGKASFVLQATRAGVQQLRVRFEPVAGEFITANNERDLFVDVLDGRQNILILAHAPHPDLSAMRQALEARGTYEVEVLFAADFDGSLDKRDLVVLHQLPSANYPVGALLNSLQQGNIPTLFVLGQQSDLEAFSRSQSLLRIRAGNGSSNDVSARFNPSFALFQPSGEAVAAIPGFPPLQAPFGDYRTAPEARVLLEQRIGRVNTEYPLLLFGERNGTRTGIMAAEGWWRWRMFDYQEAGNHERTDDVLGKTFQYLSVKSDRRRFRAAPDRNLYTEQDRIRFQASLYNANYAAVNQPDATLSVTNAANERFDFRFNRAEEAYSLDAGSLPPGNYSYKAQTRLDGETLLAEGRFTVSPLQLETQRIEADHALLAELAASSGGSFFSASAEGQTGLDAQALTQQLADAIVSRNSIKPIIHETLRTRSAIHWKALFFVFVFILGVEWLLRKILGGY